MKRLLLLLTLTACATATPQRTFHEPKLREIDAAVERAIADKKIPGGVFWIERNGVAYHRAYGNRSLMPTVEPMTEETIFDGASLTKVTATTPAIWLLAERGKLSIDDPVHQYIPGVDRDITIRHLLTHTSGLRPGIPSNPPWNGYEKAIELAKAEVPLNRPGFVFRYSDVNFILLGEVVRVASGRPLHEFVRDEIFKPLRMDDTGFLPPQSPRIAPTQQVAEGMLRGVVHDPTARRMGGVAGHAGLFTTASDLARYARMLLNGGELDGVRILKPETVQAMTSVQSGDAAVRRAGGFDLDSNYSRPRGTLFPIGSFGHTGWTGGFYWIDPYSDTFYIFLSNRVHPDGEGSVVALQKELGTLAASAVANVDFEKLAGILPRRAQGIGPTTSGGSTLNGIDVLVSQQFKPLHGLKIGLITNHTGIDRYGNPTIDLLRSAPGVELVALFSPEHGIRGEVDAKVSDAIDSKSGLPIYSLYGERRKPAPEQLANLDALVFDIQDIGARFYTYISTMGLAMEAAAESKKKFFVLDRTNPITGEIVEGPSVVDEASFIAYHPIAVRHGMTIGELAKMFADERKIDVDLTVVQLQGWKRPMWHDETGQLWINTSPNMRSLAAATLYPGVCLMERARVSMGRGTATPFEIFGAPYIDGVRVARALNDARLPGVVFEPVVFRPNASKFANEECGGVRLTLIDRNAFRAVETGIEIARVLVGLYPDEISNADLNGLIRHPATVAAIRAGKSREEILAMWEGEMRGFLERRAKYLMY